MNDQKRGDPSQILCEGMLPKPPEGPSHRPNQDAQAFFINLYEGSLVGRQNDINAKTVVIKTETLPKSCMKKACFFLL